MDQVAAGLASDDGAGLELRVVAEDRGVALAGRDELSAGQGGHVDDHVRVQVALGIGHAVGQHQPAFRVGIVDLDGLASIHRQDVIWTEGAGADHVLCQTEQQVQAVGEAGPHGGVEGPEHRGGAGHVALHARHAVLALDAQAAGVVDDALADPADGARRAFGQMAQDDERGRVFGGHADVPQPAESPVAQGLAADHGGLDAQRLRHGQGLGDEGVGV